MTLPEIETQLTKIGDISFQFQNVLDEIELTKQDFVGRNLQYEAKQCWIFQSILEVHKSFNEAFSLIKHKDYYNAWCRLERTEITFKSLKRHFPFDTDIYHLMFLERAVKNLQAIYPYRLFSSIELVELEKKCNICDQVVEIRKPCGHKVGEIYNGEECIRIVTKSEIVGLALVENPVNKYSVMFTTDPKTNKSIDQYDYSSIDYLFSLIQFPYEMWDLEIQNKLFPHSQFKTSGRNDPCPCGTGEKYKKCCLLKEGVKLLNYEFIVKEPTARKFLTNTVKKQTA